MEERLLKDKECAQMLSVSRSLWWDYVKDGKFPQPIKLTERTTRWKLSDIMRIIEERSGV